MDELFEGERTTCPRWRCDALKLVEHVREREKSPEPARKRLLRKIQETRNFIRRANTRVLCTPIAPLGKVEIEYRAGIV